MVHAFTSTCAPDPDFGNKGVERLSFAGRDFSVAAAVPAVGGGAVLVGQSTGGWLVARIDASGRLDPGFATGGWTVLPWPGGASAVAQEPSGDILVGGSKGGGCCVQAWVGELSERGAIVGHFGTDGRVGIPVDRDDSGVARVALGPGGEILALTAGGNMGLWGATVTALTASGAPVPSFQQNFDAAMGSPVFVGDLVVTHDGFLLVGTEQAGPVSSVTNATATGLVIAFQPDGRLETTFADGGKARFSSPMEGSVWAIPQQDGGALMVGLAPLIQGSAKAHAHLDLVDISPDGSVDRSYGRAGVAQLQLPFLDQSRASFGPLSVTGNDQVGVVVSSTADGKALKLVQFLG
jgi:hypothetical protein